MSHAVYEFPLNEKVRSYLRIEQLFKQLKQGTQATEDFQFISFFEALFTLLDLLERLDIRNDVLKDIEVHEKNLVFIRKKKCSWRFKSLSITLISSFKYTNTYINKSTIKLGIMLITVW